MFLTQPLQDELRRYEDGFLPGPVFCDEGKDSIFESRGTDTVGGRKYGIASEADTRQGAAQRNDERLVVEL